MYLEAGALDFVCFSPAYHISSLRQRTLPQLLGGKRESMRENREQELTP